MVREKVWLMRLLPIIQTDNLQRHFIREESRTGKSGELPDTIDWLNKLATVWNGSGDFHSLNKDEDARFIYQVKQTNNSVEWYGGVRFRYIVPPFSGSFNEDPDPPSSKIKNRLPPEAVVHFIHNVKTSRQDFHTSTATSFLEPTGYRLFLEAMFPRLAKPFLHSSLAIEASDIDIDGANGRVWDDRRIKFTTISFFIPGAAETSFPGKDCLFSESQARTYNVSTA
ncbi:hypothetical protein IW261DRAFT_1423101 [Armillaria novae-zelandiae]|uniref:Uncharacterized protein n=1 Tax=Armillaria novae-zelandiae TaxID=153914 RepID=A0AA39NZ64_9AGAR|nr:hypothetical protein IW261DRAFT_1423101 [Armillaria novae-zelandiae]